jgi:hypothetical protein
MELVPDRDRRISIKDLNTSQLLAHATRQAHQRKFDDLVIVDVDAHHYENEHIADVLPFMENDVLRQLTQSDQVRKFDNVTRWPRQFTFSA